MGALSKLEIANFLHTFLGLSKREAQELVEAFFEEIQKTLENGEAVKLFGFGSFDLRNKRSRPGRNPKTGENVEVSSRRVVTFKASNVLKEKVEAYTLSDINNDP